MSIRVFIVDDHELVRRGLRELVASADDMEVIGEAPDARTAVARIPALKPDVAVLDARLGDGNGVDVCREVRSLRPETKVIILTSFDDDEALFAAIMAGAAGYMLKEVSGTDLLAAIRHVAAGGSLLDPSVTAKVMERLRVGGTGEPVELRDLTAQERKILELVAQGLTNRQIGDQLHLAEKTVKNYMSTILAKLGMERRTQVAVLATKLLGDLA